MTGEKVPALIWHNTFHILSANPAACEMLQCDERSLIERDMLQMIYGAEMRGLAADRLRRIRGRGEMGDQKLPIVRCGGSVFWARVLTKIDGDHYVSSMTYLYEYHKRL